MASSELEKKSEGRVLLPSIFIPKRYDLHLTPDLNNFTFDGKVTIELERTSDIETNEITLHAKELCIIQVNLIHTSSNDGTSTTTSQQPIEIIENKKLTTIKFVFESNISSNSSQYKLSIDYKGFLNNEMAGFYRSSYTDIHGNKKFMASTQFESLDARRAFPCWDEPSRKAVFGITLTIDSALQAISNMPVQSSSSSSNNQTTMVFMDTPIMSSYLLAFCVGEFDFVQALSGGKTLVKVYTPPGMSSTGQFALDCAVKALEILNAFFKVEYPLPKLDMIAVPDFAMGAMENWGLVTYRQVDLCIDPTIASNSQKQRVCTVVTHELAHQWFGNLVTMAWWDDLWLNEGFASWAENYVADQLHPDWTMWDQFTTGHLSYAMKLDSLQTSHPIQVPIFHAEEVEEVFDGISYCKGGSVVRMIRAVMGNDDFQNGLSNYMKKYAYQNTETLDLWKCWEEASGGMPIADMMKSWTEQMGYPLLTIQDEKWETDKVTFTIQQEWFLSDPSAVIKNEADKHKKWCIPIFTCTEDGLQEDICFIRESTGTITVPLKNGTSWVKLNAGQQVPMRVQLTETMLQRLQPAIQAKTLPVCDRAGLILDAHALVKAGKMKPESLILLLSAYQNEDAYIVWESISSVLSSLDTITSEDEQMYANFVKFARIFVKKLYDRVGWSSTSEEGHLTVLLRGIMISLLSKFCYDDEEVQNAAKERFENFLENPSDVHSLPSDYRSAVFKIVLKNGSTTEYEQILSYYSTTTDVAEKKFVLSSLGYAGSAFLKERTLEWTMSQEVKLQDFFYPMGSVAHSSKDGREICWEFFQKNFNAIREKIGKGSPSLMDACIVNCTGSFCSHEMASVIEKFFADKNLTQNARKIAQIIESMKTNAQFLELLQSSQLSDSAFWNQFF